MPENDLFDTAFRELTGNMPLSWQRRLYDSHFANGTNLPAVIDLPTGLGKTMVMAIWLIARERNPSLPRRLIYVVDRRTVVDQATDLAEHKLLKNFAKAGLNGSAPAISTLRGQLADNREWSRDPPKPAIIIGTVDLIGSALLFSGYRSSYKRRPLEAGLLGQDSLLVLDEAHLSKPFEKLICAISESGTFQKKRDDQSLDKSMRVIRMSATSGSLNDLKPPFTLHFDANGNLAGEDAKDTIITARFGAKKRLTITTLGEKDDLNKKLADVAIELAQKADFIGKRIVVFVRRPDDATKIADAIRKHESTKSKPGPYADSVEVLTGTMRGLERDKLVEESVFTNRWLNGKLDPSDPANQPPVFLISTSAGEVGFDLNADHLVGDAAPLDSWIQRLGRVNRRGNGDATVILIKESKPAYKTDFDKACITTSDLFADGMDVSPKALAAFKKSLTPDQIETASSPRPTTVELTDILLDAWSMTSIIEPMPGRPEVGPWLRGIAEELPQTTIAWRAELELLADDPDPKAKFRAIFATHRVRPHESLTTNSTRVLEFLQKITKDKGGRPELKETRVVVKLARDLMIKTIGDLIDDPGILNAEPILILPATFGGLDKGMLSHDAIEPDSLDIADIGGYESREGVATRWRIVLERTDDGWKLAPLPFGKPQPTPIAELLDLEGTSHSRSDINKALQARELRTREIVKFDLDDEGDPRKLLLLLSGINPQVKRQSQPLDEHISAVEAEAKRIADDLQFKPGEPFREALLFAAKWHDDGKRSPIWQRFIGGTVDNPLGKSAKYCDPKKLAGYRHEFGSLLRVLHPNSTETREKPDLPADENVRELGLHLIAVHHGHGRPHFDTPIDRDFHMPSFIDGTHTESIRRFARLQRKYGWWRLAWLENLLRCADQIASAQVNDDENQDDTPEGSEQ